MTASWAVRLRMARVYGCVVCTFEAFFTHSFYRMTMSRVHFLGFARLKKIEF